MSIWNYQPLKSLWWLMWRYLFEHGDILVDVTGWRSCRMETSPYGRARVWFELWGEV